MSFAVAENRTQILSGAESTFFFSSPIFIQYLQRYVKIYKWSLNNWATSGVGGWPKC